MSILNCYIRNLFLFLILVFIWGQALAISNVKDVRVWSSPDHTRIVLDVDTPVNHSVSILKNPHRIVVDLDQLVLPEHLKETTIHDALIHRVRFGEHNGMHLRMVFDVTEPVRPRSFALGPKAQYGHRLVFDLIRKKNTQTEYKSISSLEKQPLRDILVMVDAGHGGEDPGAIGKHGTYEKTVVLSIARLLQKRINKEPGMRAKLTRNGDYYIPLRKRTTIARNNRADMFVSIHADAFKNRRIHGSSVYILSRNGASSAMARELARRENASDLVGGVDLSDKDEQVRTVLLDLLQTSTQSASTDIATRILGELGHVNKLHRKLVERAGFAVLKSPDIPSILVETAFISNPTEERKLKNLAHQQNLANSIFKGIKSYFNEVPPPGTLLAAKRHVITRGESLLKIAHFYGVSVKQLKYANGLKSDLIQVGQILNIPSNRGS